MVLSASIYDRQYAQKKEIVGVALGKIILSILSLGCAVNLG